MRVLLWILSGVVAGRFTGLVMKGRGYGAVGDLFVGLLGGVFGGWLFHALGVAPVIGVIDHVVIAMVGGLLLVGTVRLLRQAAERTRVLTSEAGNVARDLDAQIRRLGELERRVVSTFLRRRPLSRDPNVEFQEQLRLGERVADRVADLGGSWTFIVVFTGLMIVWMVLNDRHTWRFDPYPFILLNLVLSCLAALQAPIIMMSQNRQAAKDRLDARHDYEVNLKAEMEILALHAKLDEIREHARADLLVLQQEQLARLERIERRLPGAVDDRRL